MKQVNLKYYITFLFISIQFLVFSQEEDFLKKQFVFAEKTRNYYEGYNKNIGGNDFTYHSLRNDISDALLTRCSDGKMAIEWETQAVATDHKEKTASFVWMAALDLTDKSLQFDVYIDDVKRFEITSSTIMDWVVENKEGGKLEYLAFEKDQHGDAHGYMSLTAPKNWFKPGEPLKIKIVGENKGDNTWIIVYKATDNTSYLYNASQFDLWMDVNCEQINKNFSFTIEAPAHLAGNSIQYEFGEKNGTVKLEGGETIAHANFKVQNPNNRHLLIRDGKNRLVDVIDINVETSRQILLTKTILLNHVIKENGSIQINARRIYYPNTIKSILELESSNLSEGTIYLMNSSHQDIAWMDSPEKCVIERDTMLLTPLIEDAQKKADYRFDIEDALMIKEYIDRLPDKEAIIKQMLLDGRISCGASFTQPYEEMYSGEALARQFYFGRKWLKDRFDYDANTYWNVDVPGRTPQMPQIMKKANVDYLMISRHERGIFKWLSPDSSSVMVFSPGHYADAFTALNKNFYESADYVASSSLDWSKYFGSSPENAAIPLLSDWDMSPAKDYTQLIEKWGSINQIEIEPGKEVAAQLPEIKLSTAPDFMRDFENSAVHIPSIKGERPGVWIYIHGPGHQKALKASREGDIILTVAEKFATIDALVKKSFTDYPQQRLTNAWEAKIYPDHGWGGKEGQITDDLFRRKYEFARNEAKQIIENSTNSLAGHIKTNEKLGIPIVVFNSLNWERNDVVNCTISFEEGEASDLLIKDTDKKEVQHQKKAVAYYQDASIKSAEITFVTPGIPSLGYATFYATPENTKADNKPEPADASFENEFYKIECTDGGISGIYDKELGIEVLDTEKFKGGEIFTMQSEGHGAGEFDNVQAPTMEYFDKTSNYQTKWELLSSGSVFTTYKMRQQILNAVVELTVTIYNSIKKIDLDVALLNWEGVLYREYRMALPLNMQNGRVAYEVPFGVSEVGKDEIEGAAGERYQAHAVDIHPRGIENWIGASDEKFGVTLSSSVVAADYIDPTDPNLNDIILQPILLASRRSCHPEGNEYLQTGDHYFSFSLSSHQPGYEHGFQFGKQANEKLFVVVNPSQFKDANLPESKSFFKVNENNIIISAIKKSEDEDAVVLRLYDILGQKKDLELELDFKPVKTFHTSLIEEEIKELQHSGNKVPILIKHNSIETFKFKL